MTPNHSAGNNDDPRRSDEVGNSKREPEGFDPQGFDPQGFELADSVDALTWQRMVEDRLSDEQYRELLLAIEATPSLWRDCALAFLEEQALTKCFSNLRSSPKAIRKDSTGVSGQGNSASVGLAQVNSTPVALAQVAESTNAASTKAALSQDRLGRGRSRWQVLVPILAVAAGVVFTFFAFNGIWRELPVDKSGANSTPIIMDRESFRDYLAELTADQRHELFERSADQAMGMPIQSQPVSLSPGRAGGQRRFVFYRTSDGRQIIVPVDDYQYVTHDFQ